MSYFKAVMALIGIAFLVTIVPALVIRWELYKYQDCKKVGHGTMYCLFARS